MASFEWPLEISLGHKLYLNSSNDLLLEFRDQSFLLHSLKNKKVSGKPFKIYNKLTSPLFFSPEFTSYLNYSGRQSLLTLFTVTDTATAAVLEFTKNEAFTFT